MKTVYLHRFKQDAQGTFGLLVMDNQQICITCEDPWNNNKQGESCIPAGTYNVVPHSGEKYKNVWRLENVPKRDAILIHNGNTITHTRGCILVGDTLGHVVGRPAVLNSVKTLNKLREILPSNFIIHINDPVKG